MAVKTVSDTSFDADVLNSETPIVVDFWAEWCGPCRALGPKLEQLSDEITDVKIFKMNTDENKESPVKYGVRGIPTMILFKGGQEVDQIVGNQPIDNIKALIEKHI